MKSPFPWLSIRYTPHPPFFPLSSESRKQLINNISCATKKDHNCWFLFVVAMVLTEWTEGTRLTVLIAGFDSSSLCKCRHASGSPGLPTEPQLPPSPEVQTFLREPRPAHRAPAPSVSAGKLHGAQACPLSISSIFGKGCSVHIFLLLLSLPTLLQKQRLIYLRPLLFHGIFKTN